MFHCFNGWHKVKVLNSRQTNNHSIGWHWNKTQLIISSNNSKAMSDLPVSGLGSRSLAAMTPMALPLNEPNLIDSVFINYLLLENQKTIMNYF